MHNSSIQTICRLGRTAGHFSSPSPYPVSFRPTRSGSGDVLNLKMGAHPHQVIDQFAVLFHAASFIVVFGIGGSTLSLHLTLQPSFLPAIRLHLLAERLELNRRPDGTIFPVFL